jgi:hypothetical protein
MQLKPSGLHFSGHGVMASEVIGELKKAKAQGVEVTDEMIK